MKNISSLICSTKLRRALMLSATLGLAVHTARGQATSTSQNFDGGPNQLGYVPTGTRLTPVSGLSDNNDVPSRSPLSTSGNNALALDGTNGGSTSVLTFSPVSFTTTIGNSLEFRLAAFGLNPNSGVNIGDYVRVSISPDQGATFYDTFELIPSVNNSFGFVNGLSASVGEYDGDSTPDQVIITGNGPATIDYSTVRIDLSNPTLTNAIIRITLFNSSNNSRWVIDDVVVSSSAPLPVELKSFTAEAAPKGTQLKWATASEKNNAAFEIQRSSTPNEFKTIGRVAGQGTSSRSHSYEWLDAQPLAGLSYYRLRQLDTDGTESFSPVATVQHKEGLTAGAFFPNPTTGQVTLNATLGAVKYRVLNTLGQTVLTGEAQGGNTLDVQSLRTGAYFLELQSAAGRTVQRFMREL